MSTPFVFLANDLWLDFVNTQVIDKEQEIDLLPGRAQLDRWLAAAALPPLRHDVDGREAIALRYLLRGIALAVAQGKRVKPAQVQALNAFLQRDSSSPRLVKSAEGWSVVRQPLAPDPLAILAESAAHALTHEKTQLIRKCEAHDCILFFADGSKSHKRRWCSMKTCGNRAKVAAFLDRQKTVD